MSSSSLLRKSHIAGVLFHYVKRVMDCILSVSFQRAFVELLANPVYNSGQPQTISFATKVRPPLFRICSEKL
jgi:hypothetical protein